MRAFRRAPPVLDLRQNRERQSTCVRGYVRAKNREVGEARADDLAQVSQHNVMGRGRQIANIELPVSRSQNLVFDTRAEERTPTSHSCASINPALVWTGGYTLLSTLVHTPRQ